MLLCPNSPKAILYQFSKADNRYILKDYCPTVNCSSVVKNEPKLGRYSHLSNKPGGGAKVARSIVIL